MPKPSPATRLCPHCRMQVGPAERFCRYCGSPLPVPSARARQRPGAPQRKPGGRSRGNRGLLVALCIGILITALVVCGAGAFLLWPDQLGAPFDRQDHGEFSLDPRGADGTVSGTYRAPDNMGRQTVIFNVSPEGRATFRLKDAAESETLTVALSDEQTASMAWAGTILDGMGALTQEEQEAMDTLLTRHHALLNGLQMIPLDIACLGEDKIDAKQVAALLFPVQMRLKYTVADRRQMAVHDISLSTCDYASLERNQAERPSVIQYTPAMPVPVVHGYFPFDEAGAVQPPAALVSWTDLACLGASPVLAADQHDPGSTRSRVAEYASAAGLSQRGPCDAMCRGACGRDCTLNNCTISKEFRCEKDEEGHNTEMGFTVFKYDCGLHEGCIEHDACYDRCNTAFGCGTWEAAYCRHGRPEDLTTIAGDLLVRGYEYCDEVAWLKYPTEWTVAWAMGGGPQPLREVFEYPDPTYGLLTPQPVRDPERCPKPSDEGAEEGQRSPAPTLAAPAATPTQAPTPTAMAAPPATPTAAPSVAATATPGLLVWVRQEPAVVNVNNEPTEFEPSEPRFAGSYTRIAPSETSFTTQERYVDHEFEYYDVSITCNFDTPPIVLNPGLRYSVKANCSHGGTHTQGGEGMGEQFWYSSGTQGIVDPPEVLAYYPWSPNFDGTNSKEWMVTAPPISSPGDTFQMVAGMWNRPPCNVTWTYRAEYH